MANYTTTPDLFIKSAALQAGNKQVVLTTGPQYVGTYTVVANVKGANGSTINPNCNRASFTGNVAVNNERPKVVSAASTGNKSVTVQFSKPMSDSAIDPGHYAIVQVVVHPEVGALVVDAAKFVGTDRLSVQLTTKSQAEVTYQVSAHNVTDMAGNPLADKTNVAGVIVDPTSWVFAGTPPTGDERTNSDGDTLWDHEETRGWQITIKLGNGDTQVRQVTSSLLTDDTDNDGLKDHEERALNIDPRDNDTDDDGLTDWMEFNEFYSDPVDQDSDSDTLFDGLEVSTFKTSPIFDDTDGDQLKDGYEINVNRNPKVADLPQPILTLGDMRLGLDVKFTESNGTSTRDLESKTVESTLTQSQSQEFARSEGTTIEVATTTAASQQYEHGWKIAGLIGLGSGVERKLTFGFSQETANTNSFSSSFTATSTESTEQAYTNSLSTQAEVAKDSNVTRDVFGARVQLGVFLEGRGNVAFTVKNLQVTALMQDPNDPTHLTPITTLTPDLEPATGFNLGPLVPAKGPIVFTSTDVSPELVEELMRNPQGIVFRFSNYDVVDEAGRNFAFTSQDINDRTARIAIDYGGYDPNGDGKGEETEILRVATGVIGRHVEDTDGDGDVDTDDRRVIFNLSGKPVGITFRDAMEAAGLKWYDEDANPSSSLTRDLKRSSFSTKRLAGPDGEFEIIYRIREREIRLDSPKEWLIVTPTGVDPFIRLDDRILYPGSNVNLSFVADEDNDRLPAISESLHGCIDDPQLVAGKHPSRDTDGDGLDDRFEVLVGWDVETAQSRGRVRSQCNSKDSDRDGVSDRDEAPASITYDAAGLVVFDDKVSDIRLVSDLKTTNGSAVVTSPSANFTVLDLGVTIKGLGIPDGATIASVQSPTQATMTAKATASSGLAQIGTRSVSDLRTTSGSPVVTAGLANFTAADVDKDITGAGIPDGTKIASVQSPSQATMTANASGTSFAAEVGALYTAANDPRRDVVGYEPRSVTDLVTTNGSPTVTSASAAFTSADIGRPISGAGLQPRQHVAEAALERDHAPVKGDERRSEGVAVLLIPDGDAGDLLVGHATQTAAEADTHRSFDRCHRRSVCLLGAAKHFRLQAGAGPAARQATLLAVRGERTNRGAEVLAAAARVSLAEPGVYLFLGQGDEVLYVGKATNLRSRLRQHANVGPPTSHLHQRYELVRRVVWDATDTEEAAAWREADLIFALRPPFNADPGLRSRDPLGAVARSPFLVVTEGRDRALRFALDSDPLNAGAVYGCFPHLGKGVASPLGIACSDGYAAMLRLLWAASGEGAHVPASITKSAPAAFEVRVADELAAGLHRLLSGVSARVVDALAVAAGSRPAFMQPALARDRGATLRFFSAGPQLVRARRLRHGIKTTPVTADAYRRLILDEIISAVGHVEVAPADTARPS